MFKRDPYNPRRGYIYAVSKGKYLGNFFVYMEDIEDNTKSFLSIPEMGIEEIQITDFTSGVKSNILDLQEQLPKHVYKVCSEQYKKLKHKNEVNN